VPFFPPQISYWMAWNRNRTSDMRGQSVIAWDRSALKTETKLARPWKIHFVPHRSELVKFVKVNLWMLMFAVTVLLNDQPRGLVVRVSVYWSWSPGFDYRFCHGDFSLKGKIPMVTIGWVV
jgi:hypothetical protein